VINKETRRVLSTHIGSKILVVHIGEKQTRSPLNRFSKIWKK
jgi:hypothetical protein